MINIIVISFVLIALFACLFAGFSLYGLVTGGRMRSFTGPAIILNILCGLIFYHLSKISFANGLIENAQYFLGEAIAHGSAIGLIGLLVSLSFFRTRTKK